MEPRPAVIFIVFPPPLYTVFCRMQFHMQEYHFVHPREVLYRICDPRSVPALFHTPDRDHSENGRISIPRWFTHPDFSVWAEYPQNHLQILCLISQPSQNNSSKCQAKCRDKKFLFPRFVPLYRKHWSFLRETSSVPAGSSPPLLPEIPDWFYL